MAYRIDLEINDHGELTVIIDEDEEIIFDLRSKFLPELTSYLPDCPIDLEYHSRGFMQQESDAVERLY